MPIVKKFVPILLLCFCSVLLTASDAEAVKTYDEGYKAYQAQEYYKAAKLFEDARLLADDPTIKANSLRALVGSWRMSKMLYREFKAIEALLSGYPEFADFRELVKREYELGAAYYRGEREPAYWQLRKIPWLQGENKCIEIYTAALKRAPFMPEAPGARLCLAHLYDENGKTGASLEQYRIIVRDFPESEACRYAMAALANGLLLLAEQGDGDGKYMTEAVDVLNMFRKKYPTADELPWVERKLLECKNIQAKKHYETADFYARSGQKEAASRYLAVILRDYPESTVAADAEKMLVNLDKSFTPGDFQSGKNGHLPKLETYTVPSEAERVLIVPRHDNSYLIPVPDLSNKTNPSQEKK